MLKNKCCLYVIISIRFFQSRFVTYLSNRPRICIIIIIIIIIITPQFIFHSVAAVPITVQTKQITINIHKEQHKTQYKQHKTHSIPIQILTKHPHKTKTNKNSWLKKINFILFFSLISVYIYILRVQIEQSIFTCDTRYFTLSFLPVSKLFCEKGSLNPMERLSNLIGSLVSVVRSEWFILIVICFVCNDIGTAATE